MPKIAVHFALVAAWLAALGGCASVAEIPPAPAHVAHAWVTFDAVGTLASGAEGPADRAAGRALTIDDPVRVASISKLVVALAVMRMVEAGTLDLDRDVSDWLGWRLRNPASPGRPITLRLLLSHRSSLRDEVDYALPLDASVEKALADPRAFDPQHEPGAFFHYSNLNYPVIATVIERASGERFDLLVRRLVLEPLQIDGCFNWVSCSDRAISHAVVLYTPTGEVLRDDLHGVRPACPVTPASDGHCDWQAYRPGTNGAIFSPQGGLRISAADLAKLGRLLLREGRLPDGSAFLSADSLRQMSAAQWISDGSNGATEEGFYCGYGLAVQVLASCPPKDDPFGDGRHRLGHAGDAYRVRSGLWVDPASGRGIAYFATGVAEDAPRGKSSYLAIEEWLAARLLTRSRRH